MTRTDTETRTGRPLPSARPRDKLLPMPATTTAVQRRTLRFENIDDALAEAERLAAAEREGRLDRAGKWPLGLTLGHLATWASFAFDGYPPAIRAPLPVRMILR